MKELTSNKNIRQEKFHETENWMNTNSGMKGKWVVTEINSDYSATRTTLPYSITGRREINLMLLQILNQNYQTMHNHVTNTLLQ